MLAKGTIMSEEKQNFMASLDEWTQRSVIDILADAYGRSGAEDVAYNANAEVKRAIRAKVLESYRNGQEAGPRTQQQRRPYGRR
jgi:hypothetical protein